MIEQDRKAGQDITSEAVSLAVIRDGKEQLG